VELKLSEVLEDNEKFRIDSEYFKKEYIYFNKQIEKYPIKKLGYLSDWITQGQIQYFPNLEYIAYR